MPHPSTAAALKARRLLRETTTKDAKKWTFPIALLPSLVVVRMGKLLVCQKLKVNAGISTVPSEGR